ncbi:MAG: DegT/DnrJ/EryC1/StrS family aminotransferase, partial [Deltaproteobacteria bacterium]|nr:DegT/DnrJ/EryC1/StrS family aminotransferase [Deltaproteobacteria bacterium]
MAVPLLDMRRIHASLLGELNAAARRVIEDGRYIMGPDVAAFEQEAAAWLEVPHAVGVSSGTDALRAVLRVLALTRGPGRVLTTPFTFVATAEAIVTEGHVPVFADVDEETCLMRVDDLERHSGPDLVGLLPVHLFGQCVPMEPLLRFAQSSGLWVVEDAAQSF